MRRWIVIAIMLGAVGAPGGAHAGELHVAAGLDAADTSWKGDSAGYTRLEGSYRWKRWSVYAMSKGGYADVDERLLQHIGVGGAVWASWRGTRPYLRLGFTHQHENPRAAVDADPAGTLLGYGSGIRHRGGAGGGVGMQIPLRDTKWGDFYMEVETYADAMLGEQGPAWYWGAGAAVGFRYELGRKK
jgi:hypothetical protein